MYLRRVISFAAATCYGAVGLFGAKYCLRITFIMVFLNIDILNGTKGVEGLRHLRSSKQSCENSSEMPPWNDKLFLAGRR